MRLATKAAKATNEALDQIELEPGMGSPKLGKLLGIPALRTWRVAKFPLLCPAQPLQETKAPYRPLRCEATDLRECQQVLRPCAT